MQFRKKTVTHEKIMVALNMTPLIDCVLQLLIFFMLSSSFVLQTGVRVDLPKARTPKLQDEQDIVITITRDNDIFLNDEKMSTAQLPIALLERMTKSKNKEHVVRPHKVPMED